MSRNIRYLFRVRYEIFEVRARHSDFFTYIDAAAVLRMYIIIG